ncbi:MAG: hypothetical protein ACOCYW_09920 [Roseicyclus sp.]
MSGAASLPDHIFGMSPISARTSAANSSSSEAVSASWVIPLIGNGVGPLPLDRRAAPEAGADATAQHFLGVISPFVVDGVYFPHS